jgi:hypothetical protein
MLITKVLLRFHVDEEDIVKISPNPLFQGLRTSRKGRLDLILQALIEIFKKTQNEFSSKGEIDMFPMENFGVVIESFNDFDFSKGPAVYFFEWLVDPHHNIRDALLEEIDILFLYRDHFLILIRVTLLEIT